jgi:hypothetical protein
MKYDKKGHRQAFSSVHSQLGWSNRLPKWRFFGEHLLDGSVKPVAIVESEKTAVIASGYFPEFTWLATGTKTTLKKKYARSLAGRQVILFPDLGAYADWRDNDLQDICEVTVSDFLTCHASEEEKREGYDLADYLIQFDLARFLARVNHAPKRENRLEPNYESSKNAVSSVSLNSAGYPASWDDTTLAEGEQEYEAATRAALKDCDTDFERLQLKDSKVALLRSLFDGQPASPNAIELT